MAIESFLLPAPVTVYQQSSSTCWAACYRSLSQTSGSHLSFTEDQLKNLFDQYYIWVKWYNRERDVIEAQRGITRRGADIEGHLAGMVNIEVGRGTNLNLRQIWEALQFGYVLLAYTFPDRSGAHMVVAFGVEPGGVYVMNPDWTGDVFLTVTYLKKCPWIWFARPIFPTFANNPFNAIR